MKQKKKSRIDEVANEGTLGQVFAVNRDGWVKEPLASQISEDELSTNNRDVPVSELTMGATKEKKSAKTSGRNVIQDTTPAQLPVRPILGSDATINNYSSRTVQSSENKGKVRLSL